MAEIFAFLYFSILISNLIIHSHKTYFKSELEEFVLRSALGISLISFVLGFIGLAGLLRPAFFYFLVFLGIGFFALKRKSSVLNTANLIRRVLLRYKYLGGLFLISSLPSLLPPLYYDETLYHLPYALKWVKAGKIFVDPTMRYPLYTFNFHTLYTIGIFLNSTDFVHLLSWLTAVLASFAIISMLDRFNTWKPLSIIAGLAFFITPVVQQYLNVAYIDVPLMFFMLLTAYSLLILKDKACDDNTLISSALICAMFVGMKPTGAFFVPLLFIAVLYRASFVTVSPFFIIFSVLGSFWYLRNIIIDGDPIPPALNMWLGNEDLYWSLKDYQYILKDLSPDHNWGADIWYRLPLELINSNEDRPLRYWPLLGYILIFPLSIFYVFAITKDTQKLILFSFTLYGAVVWLSVSYFTRYAHFAGLAIVCSAIMLNDVTAYAKKGTTVNYALAGFCVFILIGPTISAGHYFLKNFCKQIPLTKEETISLIGYWGGDPDLLNLVWNLDKYGVKKCDRIYCFMARQSQYKYYFEKEGYLILGDGVGPFRISDCTESIKKGRIKEFLRKVRADHLLIDKNAEHIFQKYGAGKPVGMDIAYKGNNYTLLSFR